MSNDKKDEVVEIAALIPTQLIRVTCLTCGHPFNSRSNAALHASRQDHDDYRAMMSVLQLTEAPEPLLLPEGSDEEHEPN